jgi:2-polyprenyl-3-methyl-5-hydroxy-6-metoxy-1,4-benzoquinol methylase
MQITHNQCPVCGNAPLSSFLNCKDYTVSAENFAISYCQNCKTGITQAAPDQENIGKYYQSDSYISHSNTKEGLVNRLYHIARNFMLGSKKNTVTKYAKLSKGKLLDIGSGTGYFLNAMKESAWEVMGIEADENARKFSEKQFALTVFLPEKINQLPDNQFDAITLWHVLEHLHDLGGTWKHLARLLKDTGVLLIAVPNHQSYDAKHYQAFWAAYDVPRHLWHFSPKSIETLAQEHGFQIVAKKIMPFDPFYIALLSEKYKGSSLGLLAGAWHGGLALLQGLLNVDKSSSVIYVLKPVRS